jgi:hypothetical protein
LGETSQGRTRWQLTQALIELEPTVARFKAGNVKIDKETAGLDTAVESSADEEPASHRLRRRVRPPRPAHQQAPDKDKMAGRYQYRG